MKAAVGSRSVGSEEPPSQAVYAVKLEHFTLFKEKLMLKANTVNTIPCMFQTRRQLNPVTVQLEWGKIEKEGYKPLIHVFGDQVPMTSPDLKDKYQLFGRQVANGICSLVINPTEMTDSGTYQVRLKILGKLYEPVPSIDILVENEDTDASRGLSSKKSETTTVPPTSTTELPETTTLSFEDTVLQHYESKESKLLMIIIGLGVLIALGLLIAAQQCMSSREKNPDGDEENPPDKTSKKGKKKSEESESSEESKRKKKKKSEESESSEESKRKKKKKSEESESSEESKRKKKKKKKSEESESSEESEESESSEESEESSE